MTDGIITSAIFGQVVIASKCVKSMSMSGLTEVANRINAFINDCERTRKENTIGQIRALFAYCELVEATTILELYLWKVKVDDFDDWNARTRDQCHVKCGADITIPNVLPFL